ncbi:MAG: BrnT family toxin [Bacteroidales bacterium]|nr:BrnT family toxin [Bacteroidales bacterium]
MNDINFIWDSKKAEINFSKHGISFKEAVSVFDEKLRLISARKATKNEEKQYRSYLL